MSYDGKRRNVLLVRLSHLYAKAMSYGSQESVQKQ